MMLAYSTSSRQTSFPDTVQTRDVSGRYGGGRVALGYLSLLYGAPLVLLLNCVFSLIASRLYVLHYLLSKQYKDALVLILIHTHMCTHKTYLEGNHAPDWLTCGTVWCEISRSCNWHILTLSSKSVNHHLIWPSQPCTEFPWEIERFCVHFCTGEGIGEW